MTEIEVLKFYYNLETEKINQYGKAIGTSPSARAKMIEAAERKIALGKAMDRIRKGEMANEI